MKHLVWNARGLGGNRAFQNLQRLIKDHSPDLLFISESKVSQYVASSWRVLLNFSGCFCVDVAGRSGGLLLFWNENLNVSVLSFSFGHIDCLVSYCNRCWYFTGFYGNPKCNLRHLSWDLLNKIAKTHTSDSIGWLVGGDFNEILYEMEKQGGAPRALSQMRDFQAALTKNNLFDLDAEGPTFTWNNMRKGIQRVLVRLDRFVASIDWINNFMERKITNLDYYGSDHRPILLEVTWGDNQLHKAKTGSKCFMFEHKWLLEDDYKDILTKSWNASTQNSDLQNRIENTAGLLKKWAQCQIGDLQRKIKGTRDELNRQLNIENEAFNFEKCRSLEVTLEKLLYQEEKHWSQRSRVNWLSSGDRNTAYFHKIASERRRHNNIHSLISDSGITLTRQDDIVLAITDYYNGLFRSQNPSIDNIEKVVNHVIPSINQDMNSILEKPFTKEELQKALFYLNPSKAPGLDGFTALFYQDAWDQIGNDVSESLLKILNGDETFTNRNPTIISLIPKIKNPSNLKDYRPISL